MIWTYWVFFVSSLCVNASFSLVKINGWVTNFVLKWSASRTLCFISLATPVLLVGSILSFLFVCVLPTTQKQTIGSLKDRLMQLDMLLFRTLCVTAFVLALGLVLSLIIFISLSPVFVICNIVAVHFLVSFRAVVSGYPKVMVTLIFSLRPVNTAFKLL